MFSPISSMPGLFWHPQTQKRVYKQSYMRLCTDFYSSIYLQPSFIHLQPRNACTSNCTCISYVFILHVYSQNANNIYLFKYEEVLEISVAKLTVMNNADAIY